jgi:hypothetical protein
MKKSTGEPSSPLRLVQSASNRRNPASKPRGASNRGRNSKEQANLMADIRRYDPDLGMLLGGSDTWWKLQQMLCR